MNSTLPIIALTLGDPAGIGPEITVKGLVDPEIRKLARFLLIGDPVVVQQAQEVAAVDLPLKVVDEPRAAEPGVISILDTGPVGEVVFGEVRAEHGAAAIRSIEEACRLALAHEVDAIVTAPINKQAIRLAGSPHPGHTEMLADLLGVARNEVFTMFILEKLRIFFLTRHAPLKDVIASLTAEEVCHGIVRMRELLLQLGIEEPRMAVAALNPHAGDNGLLGAEEKAILQVGIDRARELGVEAVGPIPADAVFYQARNGRWDSVLALYHDQGHIAAKTLDFFGTVSCTLGLPVLRTSVDHGTAFDIAGKGIADAAGQAAAIRVAVELAPRVGTLTH